MKMKTGLVVLLLVIIQCVAGYLYLQKIYDIKYSYIGDEYATYDRARYLASDEYTFQLSDLVSPLGVFEENPMLGSFYQSLFFKAFGTSIFSWKLSSLSIIVPLGIIMFLIAQELMPTPMAFFVLILNDASYYYFNFFQIGYLNNQSLLLLAAIILVSVYLHKKNSIWLVLLLAALAGISWYIYIGKLFIVITGIFLLVRFGLSKKGILYILVFSITAGAIVLPNILASYHLQDSGSLSKSIIFKEYSGYGQYARNLTYGFYLQLFGADQTHYLPSTAYVDPITGILASVGMLYGAWHLFARKIFASQDVIILFFILLVICLGITSPYPYAPTTRGFHYLPFYMLFAGLALTTLSRFLKMRYVSHRLVNSTVFGLLIAIVSYNIWFIALPVSEKPMQELVAFLIHSNKSFALIDNCYDNLGDLTIIHDAYGMKSTMVLYSDQEAALLCDSADYMISCKKNLCIQKDVLAQFGEINVYASTQ